MSTSPAVSSTPLRLLLRAALVSLGLLALLLTAGLLFLDTLLRLVSAPILATYGVELQSIEQLHLGRERIRIANIRFLAPGSDETSRLADITLEFTPAGLLQGRFQGLHIERADLHLESSRMAPDSPSAAPTLPSLPPLASVVSAMQALPGEAVSIDTLQVSPYLDEGSLSLTRNAQELRVLAGSRDLRLELRLNWHDENYVASYFLPPDNLATRPPSSQTLSGSLALSSSEQSILLADFSLIETPQQLQWEAHSDWQLAPLSGYLQAHALMPSALSALDGQLSLNTRLALPIPDLRRMPTIFSWQIDAGSNASATFAGTDSPLRSLHLLGVDASSGNGQMQWPDELSLNSTAPASTLTLQLRDSQIPTTLLLGLDSLTLDCQLPAQCKGQQAASLRVPGFSLPGIQAEEVVAISNGTVELDTGITRMEFGSGSRFELGRLQMADLEIRQFNALVQQSLSVTDDSSGLLQLNSNGLDLYMPDILQAGMASHAVAFMSGLDARLNLEDPVASQIRSQVSLRNLGSELLPFSLRMPQLHLNLDMSNRSGHVEGQLSLADREVLHLDARLDLDNAVGETTLDIPDLTFATGNDSLSALFFHPPFNADILSGRIRANAHLQFARADDGSWLLNGPLLLNADSLGGFYEDTAIVGLSLNVQGELRDSQDFFSTAPGRVDIESIDPGIAVEHIGLSFDIDTPASRVALRDIEASLFGGNIRSSGLVYDWSAQENRMELAIERLDLSRMLAMAAYDSVQASGLLSGRLPLTLRGTTPSIAEGSLAAEAPGGAIRYRAASSNSGNPALDFVNQALSNYQYDLLDTSVDYRPDGELALAVRLQGQNPEVNSGQRINLNLNISDNIPDLLRSLQAGRSIAETLERQLDSR
ncbi:MAG: YdbH domain-containing protein [Pseudomonadales bacterium]|nr:YdbH domain-containing protein [Pseudomonadales bacterium]MCP5330802.1 YdbH domain-containing protein [Pseudomonadales bacterium]MCP5345091.1 YdbH domain-containing protein [Pseudomonadales bacterium]